MAQRAIEVILMRRLASYLAMPIIVVDPKGDLVFFNQAANPLLGGSFEESGVIRRGEWTAKFKPRWEDGTLLKREETPLWIATESREPVHFRFWIEGLDGRRRKVEGIGFPLIGQSDRMLGAALIFWDPSNPRIDTSSRPAGREERVPGRRDVEMILMKQLASYLAMPIFLVGPEANLVFFNESAEPLIGSRFEELDAMSPDEFAAAFQAVDEDGSPIKLEDRSIMIALREQKPVHRRSFVRGFDGVAREIEGTAFPLIALSGRSLGAVGIFWGAQDS
jgi:PAS domain-containing protein